LIADRTAYGYDVLVNCVTGLVPTIESRYRAQQMALWIDLIPRLHRAPNLGLPDSGPDPCSHQLDDADRDSTFEPHAARVADPDCNHHRKQIQTVDQLPVGMTSFPVVTRTSRKHAEQRRTTQPYVTPRYLIMMMMMIMIMTTTEMVISVSKHYWYRLS